jgi:hypothetical protein
MAGSNSRGSIRVPKIAGGPEYNEHVRANTPQRFVDGAVGTPNEPSPRSGNPFINPLTNERYPGAPS